MNKFLAGILLIACCFCSCTERTKTSKKIPAGIIGKEKMAQILADIHIAENLTGKDRKIDSNRVKINAYYFAIFDKYHVSSDQFTRSMDFYLGNPDILQEVYENASEILNTQKTD